MQTAISIGFIFAILAFLVFGYSNWAMGAFMLLLVFATAWCTPLPLLVIVPFILHMILDFIHGRCVVAEKPKLAHLFRLALPVCLAVVLPVLCGVLHIFFTKSCWPVLGVLFVCVFARFLVRGGHPWIALVVWLVFSSPFAAWASYIYKRENPPPRTLLEQILIEAVEKELEKKRQQETAFTNTTEAAK